LANKFGEFMTGRIFCNLFLFFL